MKLCGRKSKNGRYAADELQSLCIFIYILSPEQQERREEKRKRGVRKEKPKWEVHTQSTDHPIHMPLRLEFHLDVCADIRQMNMNEYASNSHCSLFL
jgi:hypothetical protein